GLPVLLADAGRRDEVDLDRGRLCRRDRERPGQTRLVGAVSGLEVVGAIGPAGQVEGYVGRLTVVQVGGDRVDRRAAQGELEMRGGGEAAAVNAHRDAAAVAAGGRVEVVQAEGDQTGEQGEIRRRRGAADGAGQDVVRARLRAGDEDVLGRLARGGGEVEVGGRGQAPPGDVQLGGPGDGRVEAQAQILAGGGGEREVVLRVAGDERHGRAGADRQRRCV